MSRATESGAYLGGIGTMLTQSDVCPACGRIHSDGRSLLRAGAHRECPLVVFGTLPTLARPSDFDLAIPDPPAAASAEELPLPLSEPPAPASRLSPKKGPGLTVPWPMPSHLEDFL